MTCFYEDKSLSVASTLLRTARLPVLVVLIMLLTACASQQTADTYDETETQKAVISNTALGLEYMNRGQYEVALNKLKKAVKEDPNYAPAQTVLAVLYERIGEKELAGKHYKKAYEAAPKDGDVNNNYGVYLCQSGEPEEAIRHFRAALDDPFYSSPSIALSNAGSCALKAGDYAQADEYLRQALKIEPGLPDALMNMSRLCFEQNDYLRARAFMQRFEATTGHSADTLLLAYKIEMASDNPKAANTYKLMLEHDYPGSEQTAEVRRLSGK